ncbi:phenylalanine--tRNA ligase subunit alpha [Trueperella pyogenes]|uniref:phenylalanine--tRNA ligase subunit alpha n=1 Tax=Trueperella pyogenes TaxID=1661 RepID=UPI000F852BFE|nr:phenylalanine--tRNA ligase subunit alpha [Trueperella pyogenes]AZR00511.1 phenylalanine--tRNA ligase subunit alpha [Trueperella pyogenes]AZR03561.1 phenylalanine--tRNA ligase subunit alpha [Trueperella pyogenes]
MTLSPLDEVGIAQAVEHARHAFAGANSLEELKEARLAHSGDNAPITHANMQIRNLDKADKPTAGKLMGAARKAIQEALAEATARLEAAYQERVLREERVDVTVPTRRSVQGARHPLPVLMEDISDLFVAMGWEVAEGPEVENEWFNFDALNFGPDHPARQMQDTFYVDSVERVGTEGTEHIADAPGLVLRTHTSPVQSRVMLERGEPPIYIVCPGKVFRTDALDATHTPVFHQIEGLAVDKGLTMEHLKGTLDHFAKGMFGPEAKTRLRPSFFPFTEPSAEMDLWFPQKKGGPGWIEWGGCGMVNPQVLRNAGIDPDVYTGFAFGMGIERTLMLRNSIDDMRDMVEGDVRFSTQFGTTGRGN